MKAFQGIFTNIPLFFLATLKLCSLYFRNRYDFIQVNTLPDFLVFVTIVPKLLGAKVSLDLHEPTPELFGTLFGHDRKLLIRLVRFFEKISIMYANHAITVSEQMKKNAYSDLVHTNKMFEFIAMKKPVIISRTKAVEEFFGSDDACLKYFNLAMKKN